MAFDISIGGDGPDSESAAPQPATFDAFATATTDLLARAVGLTCDDPAIAGQAHREALVRTAQRWNRLSSHENIVGWSLDAAVAHAAKVLNKRAPLAMNRATGGYVRGLPLEQAVAALPLQQRAALVTAHYLDWSDAHAAAGSEDRIDAVATRRTRAVSFVAHHLRVDNDEAIRQIRELLANQAEQIEPQTLVPSTLRNSARRRSLRNRVGASVAAIAVIASGAGLVQVASRDIVAVDNGPEPVAAPSTSIDWFAPVADGDGGFAALNTAGSSNFATSDDGVVWFDAAVWNSRAVDLRTEVTGFTRSGGRYIATIEAAESIRTVVPPRIAISSDLQNWTVRELDIALPEDVEGLRSRTRIRKVVAAGSKIMVAIDVDEIVDYRVLGIGRQDVCVDVDFDALRAFYLCDGEIVTVSRSTEQVAATTMYVLSENGADFETVTLPFGTDPQSLVAFGASFVIADQASGELSLSRDGRSWVAQDQLMVDRFALVSGRPDGQVVVVQPSESGWGSALIGGDVSQGNDTVAFSRIDLALDPASVWTKPQLASGPAGWALFVTTSRPWERADATPGWAVDTGGWVVSRMPDSPTVTARDELRLATYRFNENSEAMQVGADGSVTLSLPNEPDGDPVLVEVSRAEIDRSRSSGVDGQVRAQVFFSDDGLSWRSVWQTTQETWFGSVAVGDQELLISGTALMGPPISVPLE